MKVRIHKPAPWYTTQRFENWYVKKRYKVDHYWDVDYPVDGLDRAVEAGANFVQSWILYPINKIADAVWPKDKIVIEAFDTWSMDHTLAPIILPMLKQLKETKHGAPHVDDDDVPDELKSTSAPPLKPEEVQNGHTDENWFKRWEWTLDEMIFAFEHKVQDDWEGQFSTGESHHQFVPVDADGNELGEPRDLFDRDRGDDKPEGLHAWKMVHGPNHTQIIDWDGRREFQARISNGFRLFGKYYENLWD